MICNTCGGSGYIYLGDGTTQFCQCTITKIKSHKQDNYFCKHYAPTEKQIKGEFDFNNRTSTLGMVKTAMRFIENPFGFFTLWGGSGNGKSHTAETIAYNLKTKGFSCAFIRLPVLIDIFRKFELDSRDAYTTIQNDLFSLDLLVIDEFDALSIKNQKSRLTEYAWEKTHTIVNNRYEQALKRKRHTIFTTNNDPSLFESSIYSRLSHGIENSGDGFVIYENTDSDYRRYAK